MRAKGNADTGLRMAIVLAASKEKPAMPQPNIPDKIHEGVDNTIKGVHKLSKDAVDEAGREANMIGGALSNGVKTVTKGINQNSGASTAQCSLLALIVPLLHLLAIV